MTNQQELAILIERMKQGCEACPWKGIKNCTVISEGPLDAELMIIGRSPGVDEDKEGLPFVGRGGEFLNKFLIALGVNRARCYIGNLSKCFGGKGDPAPSQALYDICKTWIFKEIELLKPKLIITLGNDCMHNVLGLHGSCMRNQGVLMPTDFGDTKSLAITHPGTWCRNPTYFKEIILDSVVPLIKEHIQKLNVRC